MIIAAEYMNSLACSQCLFISGLFTCTENRVLKRTGTQVFDCRLESSVLVERVSSYRDHRQKQTPTGE